MSEPIPTRLYTASFAQNVHHFFQLMRRDAPVFKARFSRFKSAYVVTRYEDVFRLLKDERIVKNPANAKSKSGRRGDPWMPKAFRPLMRNMLNSDEPDHRRLRKLVQKAFTPRIVADMQPRISQITENLIDQMETKLKTGPVDFVREFALPLPVQVIAEMIGIPESDRFRITRMTDRLLGANTIVNIMLAIPAITGLVKYVRRLAEQRRKDPQDDLISALVQAEDEGQTLSEDELAGMVFLLVVAGHETTVGLITNAILALFEFPEQRWRLSAQPELMESAIEEFLRFDGPLSTTELAFAKTDIELQGTIIKQGSIVLPAILSANRDENMFDNPEQLILDRSPNKHLAFGHGIHFCLGAPLARMETATAIRSVLDRVPRLKLAVARDSIRYRAMFITHRPESLVVTQ